MIQNVPCERRNVERTGITWGHAGRRCHPRRAKASRASLTAAPARAECSYGKLYGTYGTRSPERDGCYPAGRHLQHPSPLAARLTTGRIPSSTVLYNPSWCVRKQPGPAARRQSPDIEASKRIQHVSPRMRRPSPRHGHAAAGGRPAALQPLGPGGAPRCGVARSSGATASHGTIAQRPAAPEWSEHRLELA